MFGVACRRSFGRREHPITDARSGKRRPVSNAQRIIPGGMAPSRQRFKDELAGLDEKKVAERIAARHDEPRGLEDARRDVELIDELKERRAAFVDGVNGLAENENLATAAELARALFPALDSRTTEHRGCRDDHRRARQALGLAPSPLNAALGPLGNACGAVVDQVRLVKGNKKAAKSSPSASLRRLVQSPSCSAALGGRAIRASAKSILNDVKALTELLQNPESGALAFVKQFHDRSFIGKMWKGKGDKAAFEEFDKQILDLLAAMDKAVGRNTLVVATQTYEAVIEVLDTLNRVEGKVDELLQQQQRLDEGYYIRLEFSRRRCSSGRTFSSRAP